MAARDDAFCSATDTAFCWVAAGTHCAWTWSAKANRTVIGVSPGSGTTSEASGLTRGRAGRARVCQFSAKSGFS
jgi:hypothetical protein